MRTACIHMIFAISLAGCAPRTYSPSDYAIVTDAAPVASEQNQDVLGQSSPDVPSDVAAAIDAPLVDAPVSVADTPLANVDISSGLTNEFIALPKGEFLMGSTQVQVVQSTYEQEAPQHAVAVSAFFLQRHEVTAAEYKTCTDAGACSATPSSLTDIGCTGDNPLLKQHPLNCVTKEQALTYCSFIGARLPTEAEWEYSARSCDAGLNPRTYPWGDQVPDCTRVIFQEAGVNGCGTSAAWPVCSKVNGNSKQGLCDLAGNVWEWVNDVFGSYPDFARTDPQGPKGPGNGVIRGGSFSVPALGVRAAIRGSPGPAEHHLDIGFRCAKSL